jgi:AcrR family transcriptional regulator
VEFLVEGRHKQRRGETTRKNILENALKLFAEKGYDKVTVDEICKVSGTSKGSFYQHFSSKSDIFLVKFSEADDYYMQVMEELPKEMDVYEKISIFFHKVSSFLNDQMGKDLMKVIYSSALTSNEHSYFLNKDRKLTHIFMYLSEEVQRKQQIKPNQKVEDLLTLMTQTMMGIIYHWGINQDDRSLPDLAQNVTATMIRGMKALEKE